MKIWGTVLVGALVVGLPSLARAWTEATLSPPESNTQSGQNDTIPGAAIPDPSPGSPSTGTGYISSGSDIDVYNFSISSVTAPNTVLKIALTNVTAGAVYSLNLYQNSGGGGSGQDNCSGNGLPGGWQNVESVTLADGSNPTIAMDLSQQTGPFNYAVEVCSASGGFSQSSPYTLSISIDQPAQITGTLTLNGSTDPSAVNLQAYDQNDALVGSSTTDNSGNYSINVPVGISVAEIVASRSSNTGYPGLGQEKEAVSITPTTPEVGNTGPNFTLYPEGLVTGTVTFSGSASVNISLETLDGQQQMGNSNANVSTSGNSYTLGTLAAGTYNLIIEPQSTGSCCSYVLAPQKIAVSVTDGLTTTQNVSLVAGASISGSTTCGGSACGSNTVKVKLTDLNTGQSTFNGNFDTNNSSGGFSMPNVPDGTYDLHCEPKNPGNLTMDIHSITVSGGSVTSGSQNCVLPATNSTITGTVSGTVPAGAGLAVFAVITGTTAIDDTQPHWATAVSGTTFTLGVATGHSYDLLLATCNFSGNNDCPALFLATKTNVATGTSAGTFTIPTSGFSISGQVTRSADGDPITFQNDGQVTVTQSSHISEFIQQGGSLGFYLTDKLIQTSATVYTVQAVKYGYVTGLPTITVNSTNCPSNSCTVNVGLTGDVTKDITKPVIGHLDPVNGATLSSSPANITAKLTDYFSSTGTDAGVNPGSITMTIDGGSVTPSFTPSTGVLQFSPSTLSPGSHTVIITAQDRATPTPNSRSVTWSFNITTVTTTTTTTTTSTTSTTTTGSTTTTTTTTSTTSTTTVGATTTTTTITTTTTTTTTSTTTTTRPTTTTTTSTTTTTRPTTTTTSSTTTTTRPTTTTTTTTTSTTTTTRPTTTTTTSTTTTTRPTTTTTSSTTTTTRPTTTTTTTTTSTTTTTRPTTTTTTSTTTTTRPTTTTSTSTTTTTRPTTTTSTTTTTRPTTTTTTLPHSDLVMTVVHGPQRGVSRDQNIIIENVVKNQGAGGTGSTPFRVGLYLSRDKTITTSDIFLGSRSVSSLAAGASSQAATQVRIPAGLTLGTYFIGAIADYTNVITETNELNNALAGNRITITH